MTGMAWPEPNSLQVKNQLLLHGCLLHVDAVAVQYKKHGVQSVGTQVGYLSLAV